ncbi:hypothetical protein PI126_g24461, partial [Phytophthora idaei]
MVKLFCAIVGEAGSAFEVKIDDAESVSALKEAIAGKLKYTGRADKLQLFLAKTADGAWLQNDDPGVPELEEGRIHPDVQTLIDGNKMTANWTIKDVLDANHLPTPQSKQVHVLVVAPERAGGSASETSKMDQVVQEVHEIHAQTVLTKRKTYVHSKVGSTEYKELLDAFNI